MPRGEYIALHLDDWVTIMNRFKGLARRLRATHSCRSQWTPSFPRRRKSILCLGQCTTACLLSSVSQFKGLQWPVFHRNRCNGSGPSDAARQDDSSGRLVLLEKRGEPMSRSWVTAPLDLHRQQVAVSDDEVDLGTRRLAPVVQSLALSEGTAQREERIVLGNGAGIPSLFDGQETATSPIEPVSYTHLRAHETRHDLVCRLLLE